MIGSFQIFPVFPHLTVLENVCIALQPRLMETCFQFWRSERVLEQRHSRALEIATTLAMDSQLMLLDEPPQGMGTFVVCVVAFRKGFMGELLARQSRKPKA